jgi:hypothetical protein
MKTPTVELPWDYTPLQGDVIAFDTETEIVDLSREIPWMVCLSASDGVRSVVVFPDQLGTFLWTHRDVSWVGFNVAFDWWVVNEMLAAADRETWTQMADRGAFRDVMILDQLVRLAEGSPDIHNRNLATVAGERCEIQLSKVDAVRQGFTRSMVETYADPKWGDFWQYSADDSFATYSAFRVVEAAAIQKEADIPIGMKGSPFVHGRLSEQLHIKAAIALAQATRTGMAVDLATVDQAKVRLENEVSGLLVYLNSAHPDLFHRYKTGAIQKTPGTGLPKMKTDYLRSYLGNLALEHGLIPPLTEKTKQIQTSVEWWVTNLPNDPLVASWGKIQENAKLLQFLVKLKDTPEVHPSYRVLVRSGRTSAATPNIQQMPREPWFRAIFTARPGKTLVVVDYSAIELRTLAAVFLARGVTSKLAETMIAGREPHCYTAALVKGMSYDDFLALKDSDPHEYKKARQAAKAINFGVPGGLGALKLRAYAQANYGVNISIEEAREFRTKLITEVYPEFSWWLSDSVQSRLSLSLGCSIEDAEKVFGSDKPSWGDPSDGPVAQVVKGAPLKVDKTPFSPFFVEAVWTGLAALVQHPDSLIGRAIRDRVSGSWLHEKLFMLPSVTLTGRSRGRCQYGEYRNTQFQGLAADGAKVALWELSQKGYTVAAFIHDEIVVEADLDKATEVEIEVSNIMKASMSSVLCCPIPVLVESHIGREWAKG